MKKIIFGILSICGVLSLISCEFVGTKLYVDLDDTDNATYVVTSIKKLYGNAFEQKNTVQYEAVNKYKYKFIIRGNADRLSYGDTLIITKK
jgi:hypothetical protein